MGRRFRGDDTDRKFVRRTVRRLPALARLAPREVGAQRGGEARGFRLRLDGIGHQRRYIVRRFLDNRRPAPDTPPFRDSAVVAQW